VVTETVYALAIKAKPAFVPTEVHLLTTAEGAERARLTLLSDKPGWFQSLRRDYGLPEIQFDRETIHELKTPGGLPIGDIRTREENQSLADALTETIRKLTADGNAALHVSIAGGRKTMGFYAGYALSLFARPQDRLSHVLVNEPYESNLDFYYPTPGSSVIYTKKKRPVDAHDADVSLAEIPFVRLRHGFDDRLLKGKVTFSQAVAAAQRALDPPMLEIDFDRKCIKLGSQEVHLQPAQLAFVSWLARRAKTMGKPDVECPADGAPDSAYAAEYLEEYAHLGDDAGSATARRLEKGMDKTFFEQTKSKLHRALNDALGPDGVRLYGVRDNGQRPRLYRIAAESVSWSGGLEAFKPRAPRGKLARTSAQGKTNL
jgi:CRISPR-associated protein (TIGR02584 family)